MSSYRFCRTDDIQLLVEALNRCWLPYFPGEEPMTPAAFKRSIRDLQVWCSSCMVAFSDAEPIGVLIGAKRPSATLIHKIAVHPDHRRHGHGRHLLTSMASKLAILGPPRIVAEIPESFAPARALFAACGYVEEAALRDYALDRPRPAPGMTPTRLADEDCPDGPAGPDGLHPPDVHGFVIPVTVDDLSANGVFSDTATHVCWKRSLETLSARKDDIAGIAVASDERIEAYLLYAKDDAERTEVVSLRSSIDDGGARVRQLLSHLQSRGSSPLRFPKVHPAEIPSEWLRGLGFIPAGSHLVVTSTARPA